MEDDNLYEELLRLFEEHKPGSQEPAPLTAADLERSQQRLQRIDFLLRHLMPAEGQEVN